MFKKIIVLFLIPILSFSFVSCRNTLTDPKTSTVPLETLVDPSYLDVWLMPNSAVPDEDFIDLTKPFTDANPNVPISPTVLDWSWAWTKIISAAATGETPDITQLSTTWVGALSSMGALSDLTYKVDFSKFQPTVLETTGLHGTNAKTCVPWFSETRALYYRKDACEKAGVDPLKDFETWQSFEAALVKLNNIEVDGKKLSALGISGKNDRNLVYNFTPWIYGSGGNFLDTEAKRATFNSAEALEGINFYCKLAVKGLIDRTSLKMTTTDIESDFMKGKFATSFMGPSVISALEANVKSNLVDKVGVTMVPAGPNGRKAFLGGSVLAIFKSSKKQEAAIGLINFLSDKYAQVEYAKKTGNLPTNKDACKDPFITQHEMRKVFNAQIEFAKAYPSISSWDNVENYVQQALSNVWDNAMGNGDVYNYETTKKLVDKAAAQVDNVLKQNP